jgi:hypothetical protein
MAGGMRPPSPWLPPQPQVYSWPLPVTAAECFHPADTCAADRAGTLEGSRGCCCAWWPSPSTPFCVQRGQGLQ